MNSRPWIRRALLTLTLAAVVYGVVLRWPQVVFAYSAHADNVVLHARAPLPPQAAAIAAEASRRIKRSPLYAAETIYDVFLCDTPSLFAFFAPVNRSVGGIADVYLSQNVFLRPSRIDRDRIVGASGREAAGDRTLTYFIAHEIAHIMTVRRLGPLRYMTLEAWQREGYADYVGKGGSFDFAAALRDFKAGAPELDPQRSGLYLRYHLLVADLLDRQGMTVDALLSAGRPSAPVEAALAR